jgi:PAS domain-containing protein
MSRVNVQFLEKGFHRAVFEAMPMPIFIVDQDITIFEQNAAASRLSGAKASETGARVGQALHCVHAMLDHEGCGEAEACDDCVVRNSVKAAARGQSVPWQWARTELVREGKKVKVNFRVNCHPFNFERRSFVILILEGLDE